jgi:hypothetical protein
MNLLQGSLIGLGDFGVLTLDRLAYHLSHSYDLSDFAQVKMLGILLPSTSLSVSVPLLHLDEPFAEWVNNPGSSDGWLENRTTDLISSLRVSETSGVHTRFSSRARFLRTLHRQYKCVNTMLDNLAVFETNLPSTGIHILLAADDPLSGALFDTAALLRAKAPDQWMTVHLYLSSAAQPAQFATLRELIRFTLRDLPQSAYQIYADASSMKDYNPSRWLFDQVMITQQPETESMALSLLTLLDAFTGREHIVFDITNFDQKRDAFVRANPDHLPISTRIAAGCVLPLADLQRWKAAQIAQITARKWLYPDTQASPVDMQLAVSRIVHDAKDIEQIALKLTFSRFYLWMFGFTVQAWEPQTLSLIHI